MRCTIIFSLDIIDKPDWSNGTLNFNVYWTDKEKKKKEAKSHIS